jgi:ketosteroid isomerase-like protein
MPRYRTSLVAMVAALAIMSPALPPENQVVSGEVLDSKDIAIPNVRVRLSRGSEPMIEGKSGADGKYKLSFQPGRPIDTIEYELTGWDRAVISALSGGRDHTINKTLYSAGTGATQIADMDAKITDALNKGDTGSFADLATDDYIDSTFETGVRDKRTVLETYRSPKMQRMAVERSEIQVRVHGDAAVILGLLRLIPVEAQNRGAHLVRFMRAYARERGGWKLIASQQMPVGDRMSLTGQMIPAPRPESF